MFFDNLIRELKEQLNRIENRLVNIEMTLRNSDVYVDTMND